MSTVVRGGREGEAVVSRVDGRAEWLETDGRGGFASEIADGDVPHTPRGCPFQAWSVGEALRLDHVVLGRVTARDSTRPRNRIGAVASKEASTEASP